MAARSFGNRAMSVGEGVLGNAVFYGLLSLAGVQFSPVAWITAGSAVALVVLVVIDILKARAARGQPHQGFAIPPRSRGARYPPSAGVVGQGGAGAPGVYGEGG